MSRHFSIPTMLQMTPKSLLAEFFRRLGHDRLAVPGQVLAALRQVGPDALVAIETALHHVFYLACDSGVEALRSVGGEAYQRSRARCLPAMAGPCYQSMWALLEHPEVFERARMLHRVDHLENWRMRRYLPGVAPTCANDVLSRLGEAVSDVVWGQRGRNRGCTVEHMRSTDGADYFLAYPDEMWQMAENHEGAGDRVAQPLWPIHEVVFAYDRVEGALETVAKVPLHLKAKLEDIFCHIVLGNIPCQMANVSVYNLNSLKHGPAWFATDPEDGVTASVRQALFNIRGSNFSMAVKSRHADGCRMTQLPVWNT